jgi:hypothetical protein
MVTPKQIADMLDDTLAKRDGSWMKRYHILATVCRMIVDQVREDERADSVNWPSQRLAGEEHDREVIP